MDRIMKNIEFWELLGFAAKPGKGKGRDLSCSSFPERQESVRMRATNGQSEREREYETAVDSLGSRRGEEGLREAVNP